MRYTSIFVFVSIIVFNIVIATSNEDDNLKNALNSIENRQRQLIKSNYGVPKQDSARILPTDDENLMYLDSKPPDYDISHRSRYDLQSKWQYGRNFNPYGDDRSVDDSVTGENYQRALNERLLEQLMLDILRNGDGNDDKSGDEYSQPSTLSYRQRSPYQKKSFFREREINEISENLQNLNSDLDGTDGYPSSSFRELVKSKLRSNPHRRLATALYKNGEDDDGDDDKFLNNVNPLRPKYDKDIRVDPETLTEEDAAFLLKYLSDENRNGDGYELPEQTYFIDDNRARDRSKRYWLGSNERPKAASYSIRKRSAGSGEKPTSTSDRNATATITSKINYSQPRVLPLKASAAATSNNTESAENGVVLSNTKVTVPLKRGQKEVPVDLQSLKPLNIKKKSVDWSDYFGVDKRRQKKSNAVLPKEQQKNDVLLDQYIQSHILQSVRNSAFNNQGSQYRRYFPKRDAAVDWNRKRYETTADDLKTAEDLLLERLLKYTGAHEGVTDPVELERFRQRVIDELTAAYSLEKLIDELQNGATLRSAERSKREHQHSSEYTV